MLKGFFHDPVRYTMEDVFHVPIFSTRQLLDCPVG